MIIRNFIFINPYSPISQQNGLYEKFVRTISDENANLQILSHISKYNTPFCNYLFKKAD